MQQESGTSCQTEMTMNEVESLWKLREENTTLQMEVEALRQKCSQLEQDNIELRAGNTKDREKLTHSQLTEECFESDDNKVRYYTGLTNWNLFLTLLSFVQLFLNTTKCSD